MESLVSSHMRSMKARIFFDKYFQELFKLKCKIHTYISPIISVQLNEFSQTAHPVSNTKIKNQNTTPHPRISLLLPSNHNIPLPLKRIITSLISSSEIHFAKLCLL